MRMGDGTVITTLEGLAQRPLRTYGRKFNNYLETQARVVVTKDILLNETVASNPNRFQVVAHMEEGMRTLFHQLKEQSKEAGD